MTFNDNSSKSIQKNYLLMKIDQLKNISSIIKTTQASILLSSSNQQCTQETISGSVLNLNSHLNDFISQLTKENKLLVTKHSSLSNQFDTQITNKAYSSLEKIQLSNFILENTIILHRNTYLTLSQQLTTKQTRDQSTTDPEQEIIIANNVLKTNTLLENALKQSREKLKQQFKLRNEDIKKLNLLKKNIELIKEDIKRVQIEGINTDTDIKREMKDKYNIRTKTERLKEVYLFEPFENQSSLVVNNISIDLTEYSDNNKNNTNLNKHNNNYYTDSTTNFSQPNKKNKIPKLDLGVINKRNSMNIIKKTASTSNLKVQAFPQNKLVKDIELLRKENETYSKLIEEFKLWFKCLPYDKIQTILMK